MIVSNVNEWHSRGNQFQRNGGFIGRTKRTIWMGSPSLHPTYSNFYIIQTHVERIPVRIQIETERHEAYCQFLKEAYFSFVCLFVISGCCAKRWICPFSVKHKPSAVRFKSIQSLSTAISKIDVCTFFPFFSYCLVIIRKQEEVRGQLFPKNQSLLDQE